MTTRNFLKTGILAAGALFLPIAADLIDLNQYSALRIGENSYYPFYNTAKYSHGELSSVQKRMILENEKLDSKFYLTKNWLRGENETHLEISRQQVKELFGV